MDLQQEWQNMSSEIMITAENDQISKFNLDSQSKDILQDLLFKLKWKLRWVRIIDLPILALAIFSNTDLKFVLLGVFFLYEFFRWFGARELRKIRTKIDYASSTKQLLENNLIAITKILAIENMWAYVTAPIAAPIGLLCYKLTVYKTFEKVMEQSNFLSQMIYLIPVGFLVIIIGNLMNRSIFKVQIENLKEKIKSLSEEK